MDYVYVPEYQTGNCAYIYSSDIIRVYSSTPTHNQTISYKDYYIKSSYMFNAGTTTFNNYSTLPVCITDDRITTDIYYRNDLPDILIMFTIFVLFCLVLPLKIFVRMFRRYQ